jgi:predicted XRE-type DNA-binding protein
LRQPDLINAVVELVASEEPRRSAERTLGLLVRVNRCRAGAIFAIEGNKPKLFVGHSIDQDALDTVQSVWSANRKALQAGELVRDDKDKRERQRNYAVLPVLVKDAFCGLLFLDGVGSRDLPTWRLNDFAPFLRIIGRALQAAAMGIEGPTSTEDTLAWRASLQEDDREQLLRHLEQNEWNIARVARILGVTRVTVYHRLARFGIRRRKVPKTRPASA